MVRDPALTPCELWEGRPHVFPNPYPANVEKMVSS